MINAMDLSMNMFLTYKMFFGMLDFHYYFQSIHFHTLHFGENMEIA